MKTFTATPSDITHDWHVVDAAGFPSAGWPAHVAQLIRGKHKPSFTPHMDGGDFVVVINAAKVKLSGRKMEQKSYFRHTGYMGHERFTPVAELLAKHPTGSSRRPSSACCRRIRWPSSTCAASSRSSRAPSTPTPPSSRRRRPSPPRRARHDRYSRSSAGRPWAAARPASPASTSPPAPASGTSTAARWVTTSPVLRWSSTSSSRSPPPTPWAPST